MVHFSVRPSPIAGAVMIVEHNHTVCLDGDDLSEQDESLEFRVASYCVIVLTGGIIP